MKKDVLSEFGLKHNLKLITQEAGFGQIVTGFIPINSHMFINIGHSLVTTIPKSAYQHSNIFAIIGSGIKAKSELIKWIKTIDNNNLYITTNTINENSRQAQETGSIIYTLERKER